MVDVGETTIFIRRKGSGWPLLLLHGFPQTHLMWHRVAPALAREFTVICADLRGYGSSGKPPSKQDHTPYSKSVMALDMVRMMEAQGFSRFSVAGHDRGARVAYRMALDHPACIERVTGHPITGGHFFPEQNPGETILELRSFFKQVEIAGS